MRFRRHRLIHGRRRRRCIACFFGAIAIAICDLLPSADEKKTEKEEDSSSEGGADAKPKSPAAAKEDEEDTAAGKGDGKRSGPSAPSPAEGEGGEADGDGDGGGGGGRLSKNTMDLLNLLVVTGGVKGSLAARGGRAHSHS